MTFAAARSAHAAVLLPWALLCSIQPGQAAWLRSSRTAGQKPAAGATQAALPPAAFDLTGYLKELDRWSAAAARLKQHPEEAGPLEKNLSDAWSVVIEGEHYSVPTDWLRETLSSLEQNHWLADDYAKEIQTRLEALRADAKALSEPATLRPKAARSKLDEILKRREFAGVHGPGWSERVRKRVTAWLGDLLDRISNRLSAHPALSRGLIWTLAIVLVLVFMAWLARSFLKRRPDTSLDLGGPIRAVRTWRDWARDALAASARGNYRDAIRLAYWAGVYRLEETGLWNVERTRTHREYLRLLPAGGEERRAALEALTWRFEHVWYGRLPASQDDFQFVIAQLETLGCRFQSPLTTGNS